jgi:hypothetical protein
MKVVDARIDNFNPPRYEPLSQLLAKLRDNGVKKSLIFLGCLVTNNGDSPFKGWVIWHDSGLFYDPLETDFMCWTEDINIERCEGRLLTTGEIMHISYRGEVA